ncbi:hypothetical protein [Halioxenophilus sp. WMMB6]|uniref:hypothetical protein n=1 Tax=Halioxenophilus sp. WMMB6 TaxID=3073815 RepID=UPI00295EF63B|nr:hypothetical protein [Halioxenophilus sp. WMMB6]
MYKLLTKLLPASFAPLLLGLATAAVGDSQSLLLGAWNCKGEVQRPEGSYRVNAVVQLAEASALISQGELFVFSPWLGSEIPMSFKATGTWELKEQTLHGKLTEGNIATGNAFTDQLADILEQQIQASPNFRAEITQLNQRSLTFKPEQTNPVTCLRAS